MHHFKFILLCLTTLLLYPITINAETHPLVTKYGSAVEKINNFGMRLDKCYADFSRKESDPKIFGMRAHSLVAYYTEKSDLMTECYLSVIDEIYNEYYPETKDKLKQELIDYLVAINKIYVELYMEAGYCQPTCGIMWYIMSRENRAYHLRIYGMDILEFLLQRTINVKPNLAQD